MTKFIICIVLLFPLTTVAQDTSRVRKLLDLTTQYLLKPDRTPALLDSCRKLTLEAEAISISAHYTKGEANAAMKASTIFRLQQQTEKGKQYAKKALTLYTKLDDKANIAEAILESAEYLPATNDETAGIKVAYQEKAVPFFEQAGAIQRVGDAEKMIGDIYGDIGKYPEAWVHLNRALNAYNSIGYNTSLQGLYDLLGIVATLMGDFQEGLRYGLLAVKTAKENKDSSLALCTIYNRVGMTYVKVSDFKEAYKYYKLGLAIAEKYKDAASIKYLIGNLVAVSPKVGTAKEGLMMQKELDKRFPPVSKDDSIFSHAAYIILYRELKNYPEGQQHVDKLLALSAKVNPEAAIQYFVYKTALNFFIVTKQFEQAYKYLAINEQYSLKRNTRQDMAENELYWFRVDSAQGKLGSAIIHLQKNRKISDSLFNDRKSIQFNQLRVRYETEQKDQDIRLKEQNIQLLTKKGELQQSLLDKERTRRNAIIGGAAMLLLLLGLGYNRYRLKQRSNIQLQEQQAEINLKNNSLQKLLTEKEWLLKEIHHRVKNNLQFIISLLNIQSAYLDNDVAVRAIKESQSRMHAMSLIHQKLYQSDEIAVIHMERYIRELISYLRDSLTVMSHIHFDLQIDDIELEATQAAPIGLILNEAVTNAIKYAFPNGNAGIITIKLLYTDTEELLLSIADNGIGLAKEAKQPDSLGMVLIETLTDQLDGKLSINSDKGLTIAILFNEESRYIIDKM
jgi:two-component sensor histidine kinase/tetratricopeptide (TPR) repeat protein